MRIYPTMHTTTPPTSEPKDDLQIAAWLSAWDAPHDLDTPEQQAALVAAMRTAQPQPMPRSLRERLHSWRPYLLARTQLRIVGGALWIASALVMLLGMIVTLLSYQPGQSYALLPFTWIMPMVAALGVAAVTSGDTPGMVELELSTATDFRTLLTVRMALLFGFELLLGVSLSIALSLAHTDLTLWPLVMAWLAPMSLLSALALLLGLHVGSQMGALLAFGLWTLYATGFALSQNGGLQLALPDPTAPALQPILLLIAAAMMAYGLAISGKQPPAAQHLNQERRT